MTARTPASTTRKPRQPRASQAKTPATGQAKPALAVVPDLIPAETPKAQPEPKTQPKPKPAPLGMSGYRAKFGIGDEAMLKGIREHAKANYEKGGWDLLVEAWSDEQILGAIGYACQLNGAIKKLAPLLAAQDAQRSEIENS